MTIPARTRNTPFGRRLLATDHKPKAIGAKEPSAAPLVAMSGRRGSIVEYHSFGVQIEDEAQSSRSPLSWTNSQTCSTDEFSDSRRLPAPKAANVYQRVFIRGDNALDGTELTQQPTRQRRTNSWQSLKDV